MLGKLKLSKAKDVYHPMNPIEKSPKPGVGVCACNASPRVVEERPASTSCQAGAHVSDKVRLEKLSKSNQFSGAQNNKQIKSQINKPPWSSLFTGLNSELIE